MDACESPFRKYASGMRTFVYSTIGENAVSFDESFY